MSIATLTISDLLDRVAELIVWSEEAGLRGDYQRLWRRHDAALQHVHALSLGQAPTIDDLRLLEAEVAAETLRRSLRPEVLQRVETTFASGGGSVLWASSPRIVAERWP